MSKTEMVQWMEHWILMLFHTHLSMSTDLLRDVSQTLRALVLFTFQDSCKKKSISTGQVLKNDRIWSYWEQRRQLSVKPGCWGFRVFFLLQQACSGIGYT